MKIIHSIYAFNVKSTRSCVSAKHFASFISNVFNSWEQQNKRRPVKSPMVTLISPSRTSGVHGCHLVTAGWLIFIHFVGLETHTHTHRRRNLPPHFLIGTGIGTRNHTLIINWLSDLWFAAAAASEIRTHSAARWGSRTHWSALLFFSFFFMGLLMSDKELWGALIHRLHRSLDQKQIIIVSYVQYVTIIMLLYIIK